MTDESFDNLSAKVDDLIDLCAEMKRENQMLKDTQSSWNSERQQLMEKNQEAKTKLQSILDRLKAMDNA
ncbi:MAG: cell division protein ZapB [Pseudomonadales bacterium]|nr:cell division protein ZapB [Pseudomonadales bacterium]